MFSVILRFIILHLNMLGTNSLHGTSGVVPCANSWGEAVKPTSQNVTLSRVIIALT